MPSDDHISVDSRKTVDCRGERFELYIDQDSIRKRVEEIGAAISRDYAGKTPIFIGVLNGSFMFLADLMRSVHIDCEVDFWKLSSYGAQKVSSGRVRELKRWMRISAAAMLSWSRTSWTRVFRSSMWSTASRSMGRPRFGS